MVRPSVVSTLSPAVTLGVVSPVVVSSLLPTVTLLNATSSSVSTVRSLPLRFTRMFLPCFTVTVSPAAIFSLSVSSFAFRFQPLSAVSLTAAMASWTLSLPVPPMLLVVTLPLLLAALPPKMVARFTWVASSWASVAALFDPVNGAAPNVVLVSPLTIPSLPSITTGLPPFAASLPMVTFSARLKSIALPVPLVVTMFLSLLV